MPEASKRAISADRDHLQRMYDQVRRGRGTALDLASGPYNAAGTADAVHP